MWRENQKWMKNHSTSEEICLKMSTQVVIIYSVLERVKEDKGGKTDEKNSHL